ncbi:hypothetical protein L6164_001034 [Bauhinia variegata]|uniref:Uncharacterized protein n=1 Tax=Bauhinia variegata TaxID=167791 RepID=A0ACB9Q8U9_BAUVA|nr:hypothetical protein L6164_001034 [Bauhinia variegata]
MVTVKCSYTVFPSQPTPKGPFCLSDCDQMAPWTHVPTICIYKLKHNHNYNIDDFVERMRESLSKILVYYYPLAGRVRRIEGGRLELDCNEMGVTFLQAESPKSLDEYGNFEPNHTIAELLPKVDYSKPVEETPLLLAQLTRFSLGGISLGLAVNHIIVDGSSFFHFVNSWAKLARGETLKEEEMPFLDRTIIKSPNLVATPRFDHKSYEFKPLPLILGSSDNIAERKKDTSVALLPLTRDQVLKIKNKANEENTVSSSVCATRPYSRYEAIAAHIWRTGAKSRKHDEHQPTVVRFIGDIRNKLKPSLPRNYFGNALLRTVTPMCTSGEIISNPLCYAAQKIQEAIDKLTDEYMRSQLDFLASQENVDWLRGGFHIVGGLNGLFYGNPNFNIVSWLSMPMYDADFGWGKPLYMGPGSLNEDGKTFIMPSPSGDGSAIVALRLQTTHMEAFQRFFYEDISIESSHIIKSNL